MPSMSRTTRSTTPRFEGIIPKGQYGAGSVIVWDEGTWMPEGDPAAMMKKGHINFELKGDKLKGAGTSSGCARARGEKRDNWLLIKSDDEFADRRHDILEDAPQSVKSGPDRRGDRRAAGRPRVAVATARRRTASRHRSEKAARPRRKAHAQGRPGETRCHPSSSPAWRGWRRSPPSGDEWVHEVKFDGYRIAGASRRRQGQALHAHRPRLDATASASRSPTRLPASTRGRR